MRPFLLAFIAVMLAACASMPAASDRAPRLETVRLDGPDELALRVGDYREHSTVQFGIFFGDAGEDLGAPTGVGWTVLFGDYCRNRASWVQSVLTGPSGQVWRGYRVAAPAGPDRTQYWSSGGDGMEQHGGPSSVGLLEAAAAGGRFSLALEDDEGRRSHAVEFDTLTPPERERLFAARVAEQGPPPPPRAGLVVAAPSMSGPPATGPRRCP
ncbi:MAG: hypothetical protein ACXW3K_03660 [Brevundimonas sp.]